MIQVLLFHMVDIVLNQKQERKIKLFIIIENLIILVHMTTAIMKFLISIKNFVNKNKSWFLKEKLVKKRILLNCLNFLKLIGKFHLLHQFSLLKTTQLLIVKNKFYMNKAVKNNRLKNTKLNIKNKFKIKNITN